MMGIITALAVLGAVGNVILGIILCAVVARKNGDNGMIMDRERVTEGRTRIISPYLKDKENEEK